MPALVIVKLANSLCEFSQGDYITPVSLHPQGIEVIIHIPYV